jgi:hypothetical protein
MTYEILYACIIFLLLGFSFEIKDLQIVEGWQHHNQEINAKTLIKL